MPRSSDPTIGEYYNNKGGKRNKERHKVYIMKRRDNHKQMLIEYFGDVCIDCNRSFAACCYDFHHLNPEEKNFEIAPRLDSKPETIMEEVKKCVMICSNCHRIRHYKERINT